jgi:two-component system, chemotaxis family, protein-glutamate methylesterase/glutaminase
MAEPKVRVLVVDDSAFARKVLREVVAAAPGLEVVGVARDGIDALEQIEALKPDVVTLDLAMPELDGVGVLRVLKGREGSPPVVVVSMADEDSELGVTALREGAFDVVHKPTALALDRLYQLADELTAKIREAAKGRHAPRTGPTRVAGAGSRAAAGREKVTLIAIGASTGGPQALTRLIGALPSDLPVPVVVVLHMPPGYTEAFARRLDDDSAIDVIEARPDLVLRAGQCVIGRAGMHFVVAREGAEWKAKLELEPLGLPHRPAVDVLFKSAAAVAGPGLLAVVLTGMGSDGAEGARVVRSSGGHVLTESEASCVVYGMPRAVVEAGLSNGDAAIGDMAELIAKYL